MSDERDTTLVEERLARALDHLAATTAVSAEALERIEERAAQRRRRRLLVGGVVAPALAVAAAAVLLAVALPAADDDGREVAAGPATGAAPAWYAPQGLGRYELLRVEHGDGRDGHGRSPVVVYGRRAGDGVALDGFVLVVTAADQADADLLRSMASEGAPSPTRAALRDRELAVEAFAGGHKVVWDEPDGTTVGVMALGIAEGDVRAVVDGVRVENGVAHATVLPAAFAEVLRDVWPPERHASARRVTEQVWSSAEDGGPGFTLEVYEDPALSLDARAWRVPDGRRSEVAGHAALYSPSERTLSWLPRPGVLLVLAGEGLGEDQVHAVAGTVRALDEGKWRRLTDGVRGAEDEARLVLRRGGEGARRWEATATLQRGHGTARGTPCVEIRREGSVAGACYDAPPGRSGIADPSVVAGGAPGDTAFLVAALGTDVARVRIALGDGRMLEQEAADPGAAFDVRFLVAELDAGAVPVTLVALDRDGNVVSRAALPPSPPVPPAPAVAPRPPPAPPTATG